MRALKRDKREKEKIIFSYFCLSSSYTCPVQLLFSFYMKRQTASPRWLSSLRSTTSSPLRWRGVRLLRYRRKIRTFGFLYLYIFFLIFIHRKKKKEKRRRKNPGRENLAGRFFYSKRSFILICIFLLTDKHKTIFWSHILYSGFAVGYFFGRGRKHFQAVVFQLLSSIFLSFLLSLLLNCP